MLKLPCFVDRDRKVLTNGEYFTYVVRDQSGYMVGQSIFYCRLLAQAYADKLNNKGKAVSNG